MPSGDSTTPPGSDDGAGEEIPTPPSNGPGSTPTPPGVPRITPPVVDVPAADSGESPVAAAASSVAATFTTGQWPAHAADLVVEIVASVRDKTATPILTIARGVVYGTAIVFLAITAVVLLLVALVRFIDVYLPGDVWSAYLLLGTVLTAVGLALWATRYPKAA
jgi:hypothetical protein